MQLTPKKVWVNTTTKDGKPYKDGQARVVIVVDGKEEEVKMSCFMNPIDAPVAEKTYEMEVWEDEKWGWQFKMPSRLDLIEARLNALETNKLKV